MINGHPNDFLEHIYSCQDTVFIFKGICQRNHLCTWKYFNISHLPKTIFGHTKEERLKNATMLF